MNTTEYTGTWEIVNENGEIYMTGLSESFAKDVVAEINDPEYQPVFMSTPIGLLVNPSLMKKYPCYLTDYEFGDAKEAMKALDDYLDTFLSTSEKEYAENEEWIRDMEYKSEPVTFTFSCYDKEKN